MEELLAEMLTINPWMMNEGFVLIKTSKWMVNCVRTELENSVLKNLHEDGIESHP